MTSTSFESPQPPTPALLPAIMPPGGLKFYIGTWTGRLLIINAIIFLAMSYLSYSIWLPDQHVLLQFGAKDPVGLANKELWRFVTPVFVHIGIMHFLFNSFALYVIGYQLECVLGTAWFLLIYLLSGIMGNIASSIFTVAVSAGASGALFGLLGSGYYLERAIGQRFSEITGRKSPRGVYFGMVLLNIAFGFLIPGIDNAAHLGGLAAGVILTMAMINIRPNRLRVGKKYIGITLIVLLGGVSLIGMALGTSERFIVQRLTGVAEEKASILLKAGDKADYDSSDAIQAYQYYSQAIAVDPNNATLRFNRGKFLLFSGEIKLAVHDLRIAALDGALKQPFEDLIFDLKQSGKMGEAWQIRRLIKHNQ